MTYEGKLQKLRDAGVIDIELSFGCEFRDQWDNLKWIITNKHKNDDVDWWYEYSVIESSMNKIYICTPWNIWWKSTWHDLLYGRVCRWIETQYDVELWNWLDEIDWDSSEFSIRCDLMDLFRQHWYRKDLPLSKQENKEEIVDFIISLISTDGIS